MIIEPTDEEDGSYTIPAYTYLKSNSKRLHVGLRNLSCHTVTLHKGTVVATLSSTNMIPKMLAPKLVEHQPELARAKGLKVNKLGLGENTNSIPNLTQERKEKLFLKLDLSSYDNWTKDQQESVNSLIECYHHIFAVDDLEIGKLIWFNTRLNLIIAFHLKNVIAKYPHTSMKKLENT